MMGIIALVMLYLSGVIAGLTWGIASNEKDASLVWMLSVTWPIALPTWGLASLLGQFYHALRKKVHGGP